MKSKDVRRGVVLLFNKSPYRVLEFFHNTPGKGRATVWIKMRNLINGSQTETTVGSTDDIEVADVNTYKATYLYKDGDNYNFMGIDNYEQVAIAGDTLGDAIYFLEEEMQVDITTFKDDPIGVNVAPTVILTVVETEPEVKGGTATSSGKPAKTNTGLMVTVPSFVKEGDRIIVNTVESTYISRADA